MSQSNLFSMAMKCIPPSEKAKNQMVTLYEGDLYFISSTKNSWFKITKFMESDCNFKMTVDGLQTILAIGNDISVVSIEGSTTRKRFTSGRSRIDTGVLTDVEVPDIRIPNIDTFKTLPKLFRKAASFNSMVDDSTRMSSFMMTTDRAVYMLESKKAMCGLVYMGPDPILEGNFTHTYEAVNTIAACDGTFALVRDLLYLNADYSPDQTITSCMKLSTSLATQEAKNLLSRFIIDNAFINLQHVRITLDISKYVEILLIISKMNFTGNVKFSVSENMLKIVGTDSFTREFEHIIPCQCDNEVRFTSYLVSIPQMKVLTSSIESIKKNQEYQMEMFLLPAHSKMIISCPNTEEGFFPFILLPLKVG